MQFRKFSLYLSGKKREKELLFGRSSWIFFGLCLSSSQLLNFFFSPLEFCGHYLFSHSLFYCSSLSAVLPRTSCAKWKKQESCPSDGWRYNWNKRIVMMNNCNDSPNLSFCSRWLLWACPVSSFGALIAPKFSRLNVITGALSMWAC